MLGARWKLCDRLCPPPPRVLFRPCPPQMINEKPGVVNEYESGRAIPVPAMLSKLERALGVRLPRPAKKK